MKSQNLTSLLNQEIMVASILPNCPHLYIELKSHPKKKIVNIGSIKRFVRQSLENGITSFMVDIIMPKWENGQFWVITDIGTMEQKIGAV
jgi:hypothetical protein